MTSAGWRSSTASRAAPSTTASPVPSAGGRDWRSRALFLGPGPNQAPTASFTASCAGRACSFDASGSTDADGSVTGYSWNFGDGTTATGATATRTYPTDGVRSVTLTVTDDRGATAQIGPVGGRDGAAGRHRDRRCGPSSGRRPARSPPSR